MRALGRYSAHVDHRKCLSAVAQPKSTQTKLKQRHSERDGSQRNCARTEAKAPLKINSVTKIKAEPGHHGGHMDVIREPARRNVWKRQRHNRSLRFGLLMALKRQMPMPMLTK